MKTNILLGILSAFILISCDIDTRPATSDSGVNKATVKVKTDANGNTIEQKNYMERVKRDNDLGAVKHLYVISSYTGDVMEYSTVVGKVTSGGKRLSPKTVIGGSGSSVTAHYNHVTIDGTDYLTNEVMDEYGTYGESMSYVYWFDAQGNYHQYFPSGGTYLHISDKPLRIKKANFSVTIDDSK